MKKLNLKNMSSYHLQQEGGFSLQEGLGIWLVPLVDFFTKQFPLWKMKKKAMLKDLIHDEDFHNWRKLLDNEQNKYCNTYK